MHFQIVRQLLTFGGVPSHGIIQTNNVEKNNVLLLAFWIMIILGMIMVYLGGFYAPKLMLPPIITGIGFLVIAWVFRSLRN